MFEYHIMADVERSEAAATDGTLSDNPTTIGETLVRMRAERAALEKRLYEIRRDIEAKIAECDHEWVRTREDGPYGERYRYCARCDVSTK